MKKFTIYYFVDENGIPFYVGKTSNIKTRRWNHKTNINTGSNYYKYNKARKILNDNPELDFYKDIFKIVETNINSDEINNKEIQYIKELKENGIKLTNLTKGGEGNYNKQNIKIMSKKISKLHKGRKRSKEVCEKISKSNKNKPKSQEHIKNLKKAWKKRKINFPVSEETKKKMSNSSTGKINLKIFLVTNPFGNKYVTKQGLTYFCKEHNLTASLMIKVANGERKTHKGWTCERMFKKN